MTKEQLEEYKRFLKDAVKDVNTRTATDRMAFKVALDKLNEVTEDA